MDPETNACLTRIYSLLYQLGARANTRGFRYASCAILLLTREPRRASRELYAEVARLYNVPPDEARQSIRRVVSLIWKRNPDLLRQLADTPLYACPTPRQFFTFTSRHLKKRVLRG